MKALTKGLILVLLTSCAKYQYFTIDSQLGKNDKGVHYFENDTLIIQYSFNRKGHLIIELENKLDQLIYVDWEKSAIITRDAAIPYLSNKQRINGSAETIDFLGIESTSFEGTVTQSPQRSYIPPKAKLSRAFTKVPISFMKFDDTIPYDKKEISYSSVREYNFNHQDSMGYFRSYLYVNSEEYPKGNSSIFDHDFWISRVSETHSPNFPTGNNQFRRETATAAGTTMVGLGAGALLVLAVAANAEEE